MNIQLRDSLALQEAIKARRGKKQLPSIQLHPELIDGIVDCSRGHFEVRSEILVGDHRGEPNPIDVQNLSDFLKDPDTCTAQWKVITVKQGDAVHAIPNELIFTFDRPNGGKLVVRTQAVADVAKLTSAIPTDRILRLHAKNEGGKIVLEREAGQKELPVSPMTDAELQLQAAKVGVKWDKAASRETMIERIAKALEKGKEPEKAEMTK